jgi:hypothetical protein
LLILVSNYKILLPAINHIKLYLATALTGILCFFCQVANSQHFSVTGGGSKNIQFVMVRNLIVIKVKINNKGPYNFVLDTGVGSMLITDPSLIDSVELTTKRIIKITGYGQGEPLEAYLTPPLKIDIDGLTSHNVSAAIFKRDAFGLSNYSGLKIHGLIGYEFFSQLAVKINFADSIIKVSDPKHMRFYKRGVKIPLSIEARKPYLNARVTFADGTEKQSKLIVDLGAGHFLSMENVKDKNKLQKQYIPSNLGMGINGLISGTLSRIKELDIGRYKMKHVITGFPQDSIGQQFLTVPRDGNIGMGLLKKFDIIFDYPDSIMYLKPGLGFSRTDEHDMSGLVYYG